MLYDKIGPGIHPCHWCHKPVGWTRELTTTSITVDHLDWDRMNDDPANLVPSCSTCNGNRLSRGHKMTLETADALRIAAPGLTYAELGRRFGITDCMARRIVLGQAWVRQQRMVPDGE